MLPTPLAPLEEDRRRLVSLLDLLDTVAEPEARADLAVELVRSCSRYDDAKDRAIVPVLRGRPGHEPELGHAEHNEHAVREAMREIRRWMRHVEPKDVHASDPDGFERQLDRLIEAARAELTEDEGELFPLVDQLDPRERAELEHRLQRAVAHASSHPNPPHNAIGRVIVGFEEKLERAVHDRPTPWHPGLRQLDDHHEGQSGAV